MSDTGSTSSEQSEIITTTRTEQPPVAGQNGVEQPTSNNASLTSEDSERLSMTLLCSMITPFNGDRNELSNFLINCNNAFYLAQPNQIKNLTFFIFSKLSANVKTAINISQILSWSDLRSTLKRTYGTLEDVTDLLQQLETSAQKPNESVKEFYLRLEGIKVKCLKHVSEENENPSELCGKIAMINQTALRRFCRFSKEEISRVLRQKENLTDINKAYNFAIVEEQALSLRKMSFNNSGPSTSSLKCKICRRTNHDTKNCRVKNNYGSSQWEPGPSRPNNNNSSYKKCDFCHRSGHTEQDCYKKKNEQRNKQMHPDPKINVTLNSRTPAVKDAPQSVQINLEAFTLEQMF